MRYLLLSLLALSAVNVATLHADAQEENETTEEQKEEEAKQ